MNNGKIIGITIAIILLLIAIGVFCPLLLIVIFYLAIYITTK